MTKIIWLDKVYAIWQYQYTRIYYMWTREIYRAQYRLGVKPFLALVCARVPSHDLTLPCVYNI